MKIVIETTPAELVELLDVLASAAPAAVGTRGDADPREVADDNAIGETVFTVSRPAATLAGLK